MVTNFIIVSLISAGPIGLLGLMAVAVSPTPTGRQIRQTLGEWAATDPCW